MQNQINLQVLSFGCSDPLGAIGIQADIGSFAAMGCHGLTVVTTILAGDTTQITSMEPIDAEILTDQARIILEDVPVHAFKIGTIGSVENVSVIAEIVSDYPDIPLIFDPFSSSLSELESDTDDIFLAINELIIPQATLLIASSVEISRLAETWRESSAADLVSDNEPVPDTLPADVQHIIDSGCEYVLVTGATTSGSAITNNLYDQSGVVQKYNQPRLSGSFLGAGTTLSASITALVANGLAMADAITEAQEFTQAALTHAQRFGMGKLVPDRYFWARESDESNTPDST